MLGEVLLDLVVWLFGDVFLLLLKAVATVVLGVLRLALLPFRAVRWAVVNRPFRKKPPPVGR